jgi:sulfur carrier protein ThiS
MTDAHQITVSFGSLPGQLRTKSVPVGTTVYVLLVDERIDRTAFDAIAVNGELLDADRQLNHGDVVGLFNAIRGEKTVSRDGHWRMHANDPDPWPSRPHAHNYETNEVLNLETGDIYRARDRGDRRTRKLSARDLAYVRLQFGLDE